MILVNSQWSKDALIRQGVPAEKMFIVPVAYEPEKNAGGFPQEHPRPVHRAVDWIGESSQGDSIPDRGGKKNWSIPRGFNLSSPGRCKSPSRRWPPRRRTCSFWAASHANQTEEMYRKSRCVCAANHQRRVCHHAGGSDGSGDYRSVTTPHCGEVVTSGVDGLIVPAFNSDALANAISHTRPGPVAASRNVSRARWTRALIFVSPVKRNWPKKRCRTIARVCPGTRRDLKCKPVHFEFGHRVLIGMIKPGRSDFRPCSL